MQDFFIEGAAGRLHYLIYSTETAGKPTLLFLIGMTCHAHYWDEIAPAFTDKYAVYALDWRGHGDSAATTSYGYNDYLDDLTRFLNQLNPSELMLVGHSLGGYVALLYAAQNPTVALSHIVACDVKTSSTEQEHEGGHKAAARPQPVFPTLEELAARLKATMPDSSVDSETLLKIARAGSLSLPGGGYALKYDRKLLDFEAVNPFVFAPQVQIPVLVINGERSIVMNHEQAQKLTTAIPVARQVEIPNAGHFVFLDQPQSFIASLEEFFGQNIS